MNKKEYYSISAKQKLPNRCPILNNCERRLLSIYFLGFYDCHDGKDLLSFLINKGVISRENAENIIPVSGEQPNFIGGKTLIAYNNFCPEVSLFDSDYRFGFMKEIASVKGEWDDFRSENNKFKNYECRHFSECPEFCTIKFDSAKSLQKTNPKNKRTGISKQLRFEVFQRDGFTCKYCGRSQEEGVKLHVDHKKPIDAGGTDEFSNLITSCEDCNFGKSNKII